MAIGAVDKIIVCWDVEAVFDDGGGNEHVEFVVHKGEHHLFEFALAQLAMADRNARGGNEFLDARRDLIDVFDAVVDEVDLAAALEFEFDGGANDLFIELRDHGLNGHAVFGRRLDDRHVAQTHQRHVQSARNGRGAHGEHVNLLAHLFEAFLVTHAEALLFVDDEQAEVLEPDVFRKQAVGTDQDSTCGFDFFDNLLLLLGRPEAGDHLDVDGELRKAPLERLEVLEAEHRGGREHRDLLAVLHGFERGAHGHFGFAVANIAAEQPIHGCGRLHIVLDGADRRDLVVGLVIVEGVFKFLLEFVVL